MEVNKGLHSEAEEGITAEAQAEIDAMNAARAARWSVRPQGAEFREEFNPRRDYGWSARRPWLRLRASWREDLEVGELKAACMILLA